MKNLILKIAFIVVSLYACNSSYAQLINGNYYWDSNEKTMVMGKWSQLFYEINVGWNISGYEEYANFLYFGLGLGYPVNTDNAWRKFLPKQQIPSNEEEAELFGSMNTDDVYGGKIGIGLIHYFNHTIGFYGQVSWGFLADFGSPSDEDTSSISNTSGKKTFIYNTVPVELGLCLNVCKGLHIQCGATYMWKEIPLVTIGAGYVF